MYTIKKNVLNKILNKKFNSMVGNICERIELFAHEKGIDIDSTEVRKEIKDIKKNAYDAMRDIEGQVDAFSNGVNINVKLIRPDSK
ncbi:MAG: hypothetical protein PVG65_01050 [Candidatus Thorarchaeota archaeon]|jgi:hypothetical protein